MDRIDWLKQMRREAEERYDTLWAPLYGEKYGLYENTTHQQFIQKFLGHLPQHSRILDAACGAGRYFPMLLEQGHTVVGIDQSQGMLSNASARFPGVQLEKVGLQEMDFHEAFDGIICIDALEHVFPEDWQLVLSNFHQALKPRAYLYFTVETGDEEEVKKAFSQGRQLGLPVIYGECPEESGVYHYYPSIQQVKEWVQQAGLDLLEEGEGNGYHHFVICKTSPDTTMQGKGNIYEKY